MIPQLAASILLLTTSAHATTFMSRPFPDTTRDAAAIVRGKVGMAYTRWGSAGDGTRRIYTYTELSVDEIFKGSTIGRTVMMRQLGGEKDGVALEVAGTARFERGEDVVVFLGEENSDSTRDVYGMMMGKFGIERGDDGKEQLTGPAIADHHEHGVVNQPGAEKPVHQRWTLEALRTLVRDQERSGPSLPGSAPSPGPSGIPELKPGDAHRPPGASALQDLTAEGQTLPHRRPWVWAVGAALGVLAWVLRRRV